MIAGWRACPVRAYVTWDPCQGAIAVSGYGIGHTKDRIDAASGINVTIEIMLDRARLKGSCSVDKQGLVINLTLIVESALFRFLEVRKSDTRTLPPTPKT